MAHPSPSFVVVPGLGGSDAEHWQSHWVASEGLVRFQPSSWDEPELEDWLAALDGAVGDATPVLVAHSLGCLASIAWARRHPHRVAGLFLVAVPDPGAALFPLPSSPFSAVDLESPAPVPTLVVASDDDGYCAPARSEEIAAALCAGRVDVGRAGHLNAASGLGSWARGRGLLAAFAAGLGLADVARG